ncbi:hypothetical protein GCM10009038_30300 [Salinicola rhizosphaerae]|uniref:Uncharacterized protein n=1 Tax=Salinicola rhizosphaerae TaxID=1443141 RepID=A0ABQ3E9N4_9GAMM|nr:hypothetical protein GCM10009038_30300 [Salinicola rhizosphaerae]
MRGGPPGTRPMLPADAVLAESPANALPGIKAFHPPNTPNAPKALKSARR